MIQTSKRYQKFLDSYEFYANSVNFRIHSSKALEKFKNVQSFQLNQLANGKYHFAQDRREVLLLKYDMWSRWLYEIENLMIELSGNHLEHIINSKDIDMIIMLALKTSKSYKTVIHDKHTAFFDTKFVNIWEEMHELAFEHMLESIKLLNGLSFDIVFTRIVDILVEVMQYTLTEIYELDSVFCKLVIKCDNCPEEAVCPKNKREDSEENTIFVIVGSLAYKCLSTTGKCIISERIKIYKKYFDFNEIYFKNYTDEPLHQHLIELIEDSDININFKKSIVHH